jgi:hypothetical protein
MRRLRSVAPVLLATVLAGCTAIASGPPAGAPGAQISGGVSRSTEQGGKFIALVGPRVAHAEPFFGVTGTNVYALRSWIDTRTGATAHQLYVADSYVGTERNWNAARDAQGQPLRFIEISKNEITCERSCSYADEFAVSFPEQRLRDSRSGLTVRFTGGSGAVKAIAVPGDLVQRQLAAVDEARASLPTVAAATPAPPPR